MKHGNKILVVVAGLISSVAFAGTSSTEQNKGNDRAAPGMSQGIALEKMIQQNNEKLLAAEAKKYSQVFALAGNRQGELAKSKDEASVAYKAWHDMKSSVEASRNAGANEFKAVEAASQVYSKANKAFIDMQKDILAKNGVPFDAVAINALNATAPTAAGSK